MKLAAQRELTPDEMQNIAKMAGGIADDKEAIQAIITNYGYEPATDPMRLALQLIAISEIHDPAQLIDTIEVESSYRDVVGVAVAIGVKIAGALSGLIGSGLFKGKGKKQSGRYAATMKARRDAEALRLLEEAKAVMLAKQKAVAAEKEAEAKKKLAYREDLAKGAVILIIVLGLIFTLRA